MRPRRVEYATSDHTKPQSTANRTAVTIVDINKWISGVTVSFALGLLELTVRPRAHGRGAVSQDRHLAPIAYSALNDRK
jgi:hypothetical protein